MLSIKSIKLPSIHVDFLLLCSCQVSSHSEYFIIIYVSLMSHVGGKTPISDHRVKPSCMHFLLKRSEGSIKGHLGSFTFFFWARCPGYHSSSYHKRHLVTNEDVYIFGFLSLLYTIICRNASTVKCLFFGTKTQRAAIRSNSLYYYALGSEISYKTHL